MMRKVIFLIIAILSANTIFSEVIIEFPYNKAQLILKLLEKKEVIIDSPFNAYKEVDISQQYRITLNYFEKSRMKSLTFVGDKIEFYNIELKYVENNKYSISDKIENVKVYFRIGEYDTIEILSALKFNKQLDKTDKIATVMLVKNLFVKLNGDFEEKKASTHEKLLDTQMDKVNAYIKFIKELSLLGRTDAFNYLKRFVFLNFKLTLDYKIDSNFMAPEELFYKKEGNYRSIAYFYYHTLKELQREGHHNFNVKSYLVTDLRKRGDKEIYRIEHLKQSEKEHLEREYRFVNTVYNLEELVDYNPPYFSKATYIVILEDRKKWLYTTGDEWITAEVSRPERVCTSYMRKGCYYTLIRNDELHISPLKEDEIVWEVFYDTK